jgi:hypothetical protein
MAQMPFRDPVAQGFSLSGRRGNAESKAGKVPRAIDDFIVSISC